MKKRLLYCIAPMFLLGSMNVSAQTEEVSNTIVTQKQTPISLDVARADYYQANENLKKAATGTRSQLALAQKDLTEKKEKFCLLLESAIAVEKNKANKAELVKELNQLRSIN